MFQPHSPTCMNPMEPSNQAYWTPLCSSGPSRSYSINACSALHSAAPRVGICQCVVNARRPASALTIVSKRDGSSINYSVVIRAKSCCFLCFNPWPVPSKNPEYPVQPGPRLHSLKCHVRMTMEKDFSSGPSGSHRLSNARSMYQKISWQMRWSLHIDTYSCSSSHRSTMTHTSMILSLSPLQATTLNDCPTYRPSKWWKSGNTKPKNGNFDIHVTDFNAACYKTM